MKVTKIKGKNGVAYYYIQDTIRMDDGRIHSKTVRKLGSEEELRKEHNDPEAYAHQVCEEMNAKAASEVTLQDVRYDFSRPIQFEGQEQTVTTMRNIGYFFLQEIYHKLGLDDFFKPIVENRKITFDPAYITGFLVYDRILNPGSKLRFTKHQDWYYENPSIEYHEVLRTMDLLNEHFDSYLKYVFKTSNRIVKRDTTLCYYDCTNFYMEQELADDEEYVDDVTGEVFEGLCQYGPSKEHRPNPIVEMGLMMDRQGIPITMCIEPGNKSEQKTAIPLEQKMLKMLENSNFIYVADGGLGSYNIREFNSNGDRRFIVTQSIKKLSDVMKQAVFNDYDYRLLSTDQSVTIADMKSFDRKDPQNRSLYNDRAYKIIQADRATDVGLTESYIDKKGRKRTRPIKGVLKQNIIITFSRKMLEYQRAVRNRQIDRAKKNLSELDPDTYKKGPNDVTRFIKKITTTADGSKPNVTFELDEDRIAEEEKYDGYYAIATNLPISKDDNGSINDSVRKILEVAATRNRIEECFRIEKTNFSARPVYHYLPQRITAHFLICYTALLVYRLLEIKVNNVSDRHHTIDSIINTLKYMNVAQDSAGIYKAFYTSSYVLIDLDKAFDTRLDMEVYRYTTLNKRARNISHL